MLQLINVAHAGVISNATPISTVGMNVLNFLLSVAGIIAIIALVVSGAMYMTSFGNESNMQSAKKYAQYALLGVIMSMSGMILINFIGKFFQN